MNNEKFARENKRIIEGMGIGATIKKKSNKWGIWWKF